MKMLVLAGTTAAVLLLDGAAVANAQWSLLYGHRNPAEAWWGGYPLVYAPGPLAPGCWYVTVRAVRNGEVVLLRVPRC
jgi:hypothetical protein